MDNINFLLNYCMDKPELYNRVSNRLYVQFGLHNAELSLLCTFIAAEELKNEYAGNNTRSDKKVG